MTIQTICVREQKKREGEYMHVDGGDIEERTYVDSDRDQRGEDNLHDQHDSSVEGLG